MKLIEDYCRLTSQQSKGLKKLKIYTDLDLLRHFPSRYQEPVEAKSAALVKKGDTVFLKGQISEIKTQKTRRKKINLTEAKFSDGSGELNVVWFNQPYIAKILKEGDIAYLRGKILQNKKNGLYLANPIFEKTFGITESETNYAQSLIPVYSETRGVSSRWLRFTVLKILKNIDKSLLRDFIPADILKKYHLPILRKSFIYIHKPRTLKDVEAARKRFAFEEIFLIQLARMKERLARSKKPGFQLSVNYNDLKKFTCSFPFKLTVAQKKAIFRILEDFKKKEPMGRLLEGDVGSGKTFVALAVSDVVLRNGYQVAYMAPTEILARQHFDVFIKYFSGAAKIGLITSSECKKFPSKVHPARNINIQPSLKSNLKSGVSGEFSNGANLEAPTRISKSRLLKWIKSGEIGIVIGTHSLIQKNVLFKNLALAIIDEQHRFGVGQRAKLVTRGAIPHLLSMTATPIPRTLALTIYGDLDLTLLDEMPPGRKQVITYIVPPNQRERAYEHIRKEIEKGRQAYVVCPRIERMDTAANTLFGTPQTEMKAVKEEYEKLSKDVFPEYRLGMLHGKLLPKEKEKTMADFKTGKINILVTTSVIEVGIDVPNSNCILIEGADRFGLAQLHQLRGRVLRSSHQAYCFVLSNSSSVKTLKRLSALKQAKNGFELAEYDLKFRGPGELSGKRQWGISDIGMEALKNIKMVEAARLEAERILKQDPELKKFPALNQAMKNYKNHLHWE